MQCFFAFLNYRLKHSILRKQLLVIAWCRVYYNKYFPSFSYFAHIVKVTQSAIFFLLGVGVSVLSAGSNSLIDWQIILKFGTNKPWSQKPFKKHTLCLSLLCFFVSLADVKLFFYWRSAIFWKYKILSQNLITWVFNDIFEYLKCFFLKTD